MRFEVTAYKNGKQVDNYIATEYKTVIPRGRLGHTIPIEEREINEVNVLPENKKRHKCYSNIFGDSLVIQELETGRVMFTLKEKYPLRSL